MSESPTLDNFVSSIEQGTQLGEAVESSVIEPPKEESGGPVSLNLTRRSLVGQGKLLRR